MAMISTMISLDAYEKLTRLGGISHRGWLALRGTIGKEIDHGNRNFRGRRNNPD